MWKEEFPKENRYFETDLGILYNGNVLDILKQLPNESIDTVITSPPYWGLRFYGEEANTVWGGNPDCKHEWVNGFCEKCGAWYGQLGLEPTFEMYLEHLWQIFDEIWRILKPTGTVWVNLGDTYNGNKKGKTDKKVGEYLKETQRYLVKPVTKNVKQKSLLMIPARFAIGMIDRGWILRNVIIWHKPNAMPESVKDRFTEDFEYIFFFVKQKKYYFKQILEPFNDATLKRINYAFNKSKSDIQSAVKSTGQRKFAENVKKGKLLGRNKRTVWNIATKPLKEAHFAPFPPDIPEICIRAGCPEDGIVLDPFMGSGTTAYVAEQLGRKWIGVEINPEYCEIAKRRLSKVQQKLF